MTHTNCSHPATKADRAKCRKARKALDLCDTCHGPADAPNLIGQPLEYDDNDRPVWDYTPEGEPVYTSNQEPCDEPFHD